MIRPILLLLIGFAIFSPGIVALTGWAKAYQIAVIVLTGLAFGMVVLRSAHAKGGGRQGVSLFPVGEGGLGMSFVALLVVSLTTILRGVVASDSDVSSAALSHFFFFCGAVSVLALCLSQAGKSMSFVLIDMVFGLLAMLCAINVFLWILGVSNPAAVGNAATFDKASVFSFFGVDISRVYFPLSYGVNYFGLVSGSVLAYYFSAFHPKVRAGGALSPRVWFGVSVGVLCLLLTDSRGALFFAFAAVVLSAMKGARFFVVFFLFIPFLFILNFVAVSEIDSIGIPFLARDDGGGLLTGREVIWGAVIDELIDFKPDHIFGYGLYGQAISRVSDQYSEQVEGLSEVSNLQSPHNGVFQIILDSGYFGVLVFLIFSYCLIKQILDVVRDGGGANWLRVLAVFYYVLLQSFTESSLGIYRPEVFFVVLAMASLLIRMRNSPW